MRHSRTQWLDPTRGQKGASQGKYQRANKNRKPCIAVASLRVLAPLRLISLRRLVLLLFLPHVAVCEKLRLAFRACFSFGADIYFAVVNFKLPSHFATCNLPLTTRMPCSHWTGRAQRNEHINCHKLLAKYALLNLPRVPARLLRLN